MKLWTGLPTGQHRTRSEAARTVLLKALEANGVSLQPEQPMEAP
jgi:hypothetical protein